MNAFPCLLWHAQKTAPPFTLENCSCLGVRTRTLEILRISTFWSRAYAHLTSNNVNGSDVEISNADGVVVTLIGLGSETSIDEQLIGVQQV